MQQFTTNLEKCIYVITQRRRCASKQFEVLNLGKNANSAYFNYLTIHTSSNENASGLPYAKNLLWMVFAASRGGHNRIKVIYALKKSPLNTHQLAKELGLNYRAAQHHVAVLEKNNLITKIGEKYGVTYFLSTFFEINISVFEDLVSNLHKSKARRMIS
jgi:DNA-binding transcriptional ArsR family regulator